MRPEEMNSINANGKAFNGNWKASIPAVAIIAIGLLYAVITGFQNLIQAIFS